MAKKVSPKKVKKKVVKLRKPVDVDFLETNVDRLLKMVKARGKVKVSEAAKRFGVPESRIEEWGKVLEEYGLVEIHYPPIGKPVLKVFKNYVRKKLVIEKIK